MGSTTLSSNEIVGSSWKNWKTTPTDRPRHCAVAPSLRSCTAVPSIQTSPLDGRSMPVIMLTSVLLPLPDLPITATNSPAPTSRLTLLSAVKLPAGVSYCLTTSSRSISGRPSTRSRIDGHGRGSYRRPCEPAAVPHWVVRVRTRVRAEARRRALAPVHGRGSRRLPDAVGAGARGRALLRAPRCPSRSRRLGRRRAHSLSVPLLRL